MKSLRIRRTVLIVCALLAAPIFVWVGIVLIAPTGWAKRHVIAVLEARSGRLVRLEGLRARYCGGIRLTNLEIGSPKSSDDPWLKAADVLLDVSWPQLLVGRFEPTSLEVNGARLRVFRRADGTFELADFIAPSSIRRSLADRHSDRAGRVAIQLRGCSVTLIDESSETRLALEDVAGEAVRTAELTSIQRLRGTLNGGPFHFVGQLDRSGEAPRFEGQFRAEDVVLDDGMKALRYVVPVLAGAPMSLKGRLNSAVYLQGEGATWPALRQSLSGHGVISLNPIDLDGAPVLSELSTIAELARRGHVASIHSDFVIHDQRIATDRFTLDIGRVPMKLTGWTDFDGRLDYRINLSGLNERLPDQARRILGDLNVNFQSLEMLTLQGSVNKLAVGVNGIALDRKLLRESGLKREDREKLRAIGRKFLDDLVR
jgi:AsmA protein